MIFAAKPSNFVTAKLNHHLPKIKFNFIKEKFNDYWLFLDLIKYQTFFTIVNYIFKVCSCENVVVKEFPSFLYLA